MRKLLIAISAILVVGSIIFTAYTLGSKGQRETSSLQVSVSPTQALLGGDKDEHGCIPSAGYTWCEQKNKCLRTWEETCFESVEDEIEAILAKKYDKLPDEVKVTITKKNDSFAGGSVTFGKGGPGEVGMFLARKIDNAWEVVFDGNGNVDCAKMRQVYGFPDEVLVPNFCD